MDCVFCKIVNGEIKSRLIMESKNSIAFLDAFPVTKGHTLVIPKTHYGKIQDMSQDDSVDLFRVVYEVVPKKYLKNAGHTILLHGRYTCKARTPSCMNCAIIKYCNYKHKEL